MITALLVLLCGSSLKGWEPTRLENGSINGDEFIEPGSDGECLGIGNL